MHYGPAIALDHVSFQANPGEVLGLLGPNGAGKTTAMRILTTYLFPSSGTAKVDGFDILENPIEVRKRIGYLPETVPLYGDMRVDEYLTFVGKARALTGARLAERLEWVQKACHLRNVWKHLLCELSKGFGQRVGLAQALIHDPKVLILDEPTSGLDLRWQEQLTGIIERLSQTLRLPIVMTTHILSHLPSCCNRAALLRGGRILFDGPIAEALTSARLSELYECPVEIVERGGRRYCIGLREKMP